MTKKKPETRVIKPIVVAIVVILIMLTSITLYIYVNSLYRPKVSEKYQKESEERTGVGRSVIYFKDRYGVYVQTHVYYPSEWGEKSPPLRNKGTYMNGYPLIVFGEGWKADNSIYEWLGMNLSLRGYIVAIPDFVNNTSPWAETENGMIGGLYCDTYGGNASLPLQYVGSNELWPDVWPWVYELIDCIKFFINATLFGYTFNNGNVTIDLKGLIDKDRIAIGGHSTGGSMALVAASIYKDIKVAFAYAPYDDVPGDIYWEPYPSSYIDYKGSVPFMLMVGTKDVVCPPGPNSEKIYSLATSPKILVEINMGNHMYFCDKDDIKKVDTELPHELPITPVPISIETQQTAAIDYTLAFLNYYFSPQMPLKSPYNLSEDIDSDGIADVNKTFDQGPVIFDVEYSYYDDLYLFRCHIVPLGIGWGNSSVSARFYIASLETQFSPVKMNYFGGYYTSYNAGWFYCKLREPGTYTLTIEVRNVRGQIFKSNPMRVIMA